MQRTDAVIIGAGQAGLAMSRCLGTLGVDHVVLERGRVAERWRSARWDSLRLLTPNWMTRLPGWAYRGPDPDGFMTMPEIADFLEDYAAASAAPVVEGAEVCAVRPAAAGGYIVETGDRTWHGRAVVIATGACDRPAVPAISRNLPPEIVQMVPSAYRRPDDLPAGGVLVVGAAATGVQLAEEIHRSGRPVTLSVGRHIRVPRRYRGRDIMEWLDRAGILTEPAAEMRDLGRARAQPSFQLAGRRDGSTVDLASLEALGLRIAGRTAAIEGGTVRFQDDLPETLGRAQATLERLLDRLDAVAGPADPPPEPEARRPILLPPGPAALDLSAEGITSVVWATGYRRVYGWLQVPVLDACGEVVHDGGVTPAPGLYVLGLRLLRRRKSSFIDGVGADAEALARHLHDFLDTGRRGARPALSRETGSWRAETVMTQ
ncbi:MAG: NAD(P)-binding domain-containing protein [Alphaproteobacteria bacterium]|jgi:putative flavoprotein involved in K+ transport|nr:NAD(P)-binding domain-containing protein [Alphaproteobacteria bacterium]